MTFDVITIFPRLVDAGLAEGVVGRARERGLIDVTVRNLRDFTTDRHHVVDDVPFGGGPGMVMKPEPFFAAMEALEAERGRAGAVVLLTPAGRRFTQEDAGRLASRSPIVLLCGRYEGIDERVRERWVTDEISIGDYVLSGGEIPALVVIDAVSRLVPGVVGDEQSVEGDSFVRGLLDFPHYTRPAELTIDDRLPGTGARALKVPDVLLSGNHAEIRHWRKREAISRTLQRRPDLLASADLDDEEREILRQLTAGKLE